MCACVDRKYDEVLCGKKKMKRERVSVLLAMSSLFVYFACYLGMLMHHNMFVCFYFTTKKLRIDSDLSGMGLTRPIGLDPWTNVSLQSQSDKQGSGPIEIFLRKNRMAPTLIHISDFCFCNHSMYLSSSTMCNAT